MANHLALSVAFDQQHRENDDTKNSHADYENGLTHGGGVARIVRQSLRRGAASELYLSAGSRGLGGTNQRPIANKTATKPPHIEQE